MSETLAPDLLDLMEHEKVIEQGLATFVEVGWALLAIRDGKRYRAAGYATFEDYCRRRWDMSDRHARRLMDAADTARMLESGPTGPVSERQLRPLTSLRDEPDQAVAAWELAVDQAEGEQPTPAEVAEAVRQVRTPQPVPKADLGGVSHPAVFSADILAVCADLLHGRPRVLDPFAGTGKVHQLQPEHETVGVELEPEWATLHPDTVVGSALALPFDPASFDAICTSPTYGNRLADHHDASDPEARRSYTHDLGRPLHPDNSGAMQWGREYRRFHRDAWREAVRVLRPGGRFVLNIKDHVRSGRWQDVAGWHVAELVRLGLIVVAIRPVPTRGQPLGVTGEVRAGAELVIGLDKAA